MTLGLGITEGLEDGISILLSDWRPIWCAGSAGAIARFPLIGGVERLTVFADRDDAGMTAAGQCLHRWRIAGRQAAVVPPTVEEDWAAAHLAGENAREAADLKWMRQP